MPRIVEYLLELNRKKYQDVKILETREKIRRLKLENAVRRGELISKEKLFEELAPLYHDLRRGFERLLLLGVPQGVIDEFVEILEHGANNGNGNSDTAGAAGQAEASAGSDYLD